MDEDKTVIAPHEGALQEGSVEQHTGAALLREEEAKLPQMNVATFPSQLFWLSVTFVALYVVLARFIMPRIHEVLETRQDRIAHDLDRASRLQQEAEEAKSVYKKALADARGDAQELLAGVTQSIKETTAEKSAELDAVLKSKLEESAKDIYQAVDNAQKELAPVSAELTALIVEKLINYRPSEQEVESVIGEISMEQRAA